MINNNNNSIMIERNVYTVGAHTPHTPRIQFCFANFIDVNILKGFQLTGTIFVHNAQYI